MDLLHTDAAATAAALDTFRRLAAVRERAEERARVREVDHAWGGDRGQDTPGCGRGRGCAVILLADVSRAVSLAACVIRTGTPHGTRPASATAAATTWPPMSCPSATQRPPLIGFVPWVRGHPGQG